MTEETDAILDAITELLPRLLALLDTLAWVGRTMHPPHLPALAAATEEAATEARTALDRFRGLDWPDRLAPFSGQLGQAADHALRACALLHAAPGAASPMRDAYRALRQHAEALEALYPLAAMLPPVSRYFLEPARRDDPALLGRLSGAGGEGTGVIHVGGEPGMRGGFSLYVPEYLDPTQPCPLVMALHGGSGNGRLFLWNWVREARSRGVIVAAPTATGDTWSLMEPEVDSAHLDRVLAHVRQRWTLDPARLLLTGMSDGGTFTLVSGLADDSPFTHLAPIAASFHPLLLVMAEPRRIRGLPVHLIHGALDWMFPVTVGRSASQALAAAGARVVYHELADLSHAYPRDEGSRIMDWFLGLVPGAVTGIRPAGPAPSSSP